MHRHGRCRDYGYWRGTRYAGRRLSGRGYWVYAYPDWFVWWRKVR